MQLPDEAIDFNYQGMLIPTSESWTPLGELQTNNFLTPERLEALKPQLQAIRSRVAGEREIRNPPPHLKPLDSGFIDYPGLLLEQFRTRGDSSELSRILAVASRLRDNVDRVVLLGIGGSYLGARALFDSLCHGQHNELPPRMRLGKPRIYFEGHTVDNDSLQDLIELLENTCVDPELREERWGTIVISKSGGTLETATAYRIIRNELNRYYGNSLDKIRKFIVPITGSTGKFRELLKAEGFADDQILTIPENVGGRFSIFTAAGLLPAAVMGLDVRALLIGAASMTKRFLEEPFERNPVLQYAAVNYLMTEEKGKNVRVLSVWTKKLEAVGLWYDQLLSESLGKRGRGATPLTVVQPRDLHSRGQQHQEGSRDKVINNILIRAVRHVPMQIGMADNNQDDLNGISRKTMPDVLDAAYKGTMQAYADSARPSSDITLPAINEHALGQLMQMLMLATVIEGRLMNINPYGQPGVEAYKQNMNKILRSK
ncbi:glucose-6-phosphate isomerase [Telmatocola sphagniphila]|uniref:Glucose-6-phosphate isomerase n=1 Tax=Telmatocola sphagniphila TaxID=1123043 RepID=A0A8E6B803_9BACT|nr:glucose-6-phosphate isomerase [Telmatocola sphagniphila]QVL32811.1 glucose-6-phosphate isomerase [Telmatocola sphagniphila]